MSDKKHWRVYVPKLAVGLLVVVLIGVFWYFVSQMDSKKAGKKEKKIQTITLVKPPPPPPPPPREKIPPPPEVKEKIDQPEPEPDPEPVPEEAAEEPAGDTGLDAEGTAGSDGFGLVGRKGGKGLLSGGGGSPTAWYAGVVKNQLLDLLNEKDQLKRTKFVVTVSVWFDLEGRVERYELMKSSQDPKIDELLAAQLAKLKQINKTPPVGIKSPVKLRITSR